MSAIFGIIDFEGRPLQEEWIKSMQADLAHRGPDGQGLYREPSVALGHMLLQVTPESVYDKSPYEEDGFVITANARLDEREAIMDRLNVPHEERERITDPLLLLRSFKKFGKDFVKDIYGDFAFAIWDKEKKEIFCARDQVGVKPFIYYFSNNRLVFSTEIKSIVKLNFVKTKINPAVLFNSTFDIGYDIKKTCWENIQRLPPANTLLINHSCIKTSIYWKPEYKPISGSGENENIAQELKNLMTMAISDRIRTNKPVGLTLSGGLDSGSIGCIAAKQLSLSGKNLVTVSSVLNPDISYPDIEDESDYIKAIIEQEKNIEPFDVYNTGLKFSSKLSLQFERNYSTINSFQYLDEALNEVLKSKSVRRVLSGYSGDLTVSNWSIKPLPYLLVRGKLLRICKLIRLIHKATDSSVFLIVKSQLIYPLLPNQIKKIWERLKGSYQADSFYKLPLNISQRARKRLIKKRASYYNESHISRKDISNKIWPLNYDYFDEQLDCLISHSNLEPAYPFSDRRIIEFLLKLPVEYFITDGWDRGLIRKSMKHYLPDIVLKRKSKLPYSPDYFNIFIKDIKGIIHSIQETSSNSILEKSLDIAKLKIILDDLFLNKKIVSL